MSNSLRVATTIVASTTMNVERTIGNVTPRNNFQPCAPSKAEASIMSAGTALIAADRITIANPVCDQTKIIINRKVLSGCSKSQFVGPNPKCLAIDDIKPICGWFGFAYWYTNFQIMEAPTKEMAIGIKISDLATDSRRIRSRRIANNKPSPVVIIGVKRIQKIVFLKTIRILSSVNNH